MIFPLVVAAVAVFLGAWLALGPRERPAFLRVIRVAAMVAAAAVVMTHLLPEAFEALGVKALVGVVSGIALPILLEQGGARLAARRGGENTGAKFGLEVAYVGLAVHRFGDGLSMGAANRAATGPLGAAPVVVAIALHIVPVTTVMVLAVERLLGEKQAIVRAVLLAIATMAGVVVAALALTNTTEDAFPWISAVVAGLLLHVVGHDVPHRHGASHTHTRPETADHAHADGHAPKP